MFFREEICVENIDNLFLENTPHGMQSRCKMANGAIRGRLWTHESRLDKLDGTTRNIAMFNTISQRLEKMGFVKTV